MPPTPPKTEQLLSHLPLFNEFDTEELARIAAGTHQKHLAKGETLFRKGDPCLGFWMVVYGQVKLSVHAPSGAEKVIEIIGPGQSFGEAVMFLERPYPVFSQALADSLLVHVAKSSLFGEAAQDMRMARKMLAGMSMKLHRLVNDVETYSLQSSMQRVIGFLLQDEEAERSGQVSLPAGKAVIASRLNITPETFSRILHDLSAAGLISVQGKEIVINDLERMRAFEK
jgi:CRP/FNR family transcriptional regulator, dissimilatory nitrate respiration regulator